MLESITNIINSISGFVWGPYMASLLLATGLVLTVRMVLIQIRGFSHGVAIATGKYDDPNHKGQLTHFQALSAALSATIGIGNIAGVALALYWGGPGAIFWMWVTAFFGMAIKFAECTLAIQYRKIDPDGNVRGGPMYYIEMGMPKYFKPLAYMFASFVAIGALGAGNMVQSNTMAHSLISAFEIGQSKIVVEQIESEKVIKKIDDYNSNYNNLQTSLTYRYALDKQLIEADNSSNDVNINRITLEIDDVVLKLDTLMHVTDSLRNDIKDIEFFGVTSSENLIIFKTNELSQTESNNEVYNLKVINTSIDKQNMIFVKRSPVNMWRWIFGFIIAGLAGAVLLGGIKRIGSVASYLVPFMSVVYVVSALVALFINIDQVIPAFNLIFYHAFNPTAVVGGAAGGATVWMTFAWGLRRGLFSNEAGQGSAAMAHATAKVDEPVREGLVAMLGPFIDTIIICTMTALVIISTGVWANGQTGAVLTMTAFETALPGFGQWMVVVGIMLFAFSTVVAWSYYGEKGIEYLGGTRSKLPYKWIYITFTLMGATLDLEPVWNFADAANGLMSAPNLIALIFMSGAVVKMSKKYMDEKKAGKHIPYKDR